MIHIVNPQTSEILDYITLDKIIEDTHKKSLESYIETYDAIVLGGNDFSYDKHLEKRNHIIIPDEDGTYQEFILFEVDKYRDTEGRKTHFYAHATYLELKKAKVIYPTRREGFTLSQHAGWALNDTGWRVGTVESEGVRTFNIENHTNPYEFIKRIANEFEVEIRFRVEHDGRRITARYVDFLERIGDWKGREVEFGRDLDSIRRVEKQDIVTALLGLGPERDDGTRIEVLVEDEEALQRWGRVDEHGNLHHLIEPYEIQSDRQEMTEEEARRYTRTALDKRINTQVTYETTILDLEEVPGLEHEEIRFGDTIRIKDVYFNPPLYLEARVFEIERSIKNKAKKDIKLGDYVEYTEEEINAIWNQLRNEIRRRLDRMAIVTINSTAGNVFKNAQGETELTARTFVNGAERDEDGTLYDYQWMRFDKDGNHDTNFYAEGKTITVTANDIDEKATYRVLVAYELEVINTAEITISNVFDGEDGEPGPPGPKGDKGDKGDPGPQGPPGTSITSIVEYYLATDQNSGVTTDTPGWTTTIQQMTPQKRYLWNYERINFSDGTHQNTNPVIIGVYGDEGEEGRSIVSITEYYLASSASSGVTRNTSGWTTTMQVTTPEKRYLWNYEKITWNKAPLETYTEPVIIGVHGERGPQGPQGIQGPPGQDGQSQYVHIRYSVNSNGNPMTSTPQSNTKYIGLAVTTSPTAPSSYTAYTWSKYRGEDGQDGIPGPPGKDGQTTYTWVKYADDENGNGMSDSPDGKLYIGLAFNKTTPHESNNPAEYTWSLMPQNIEIGGRNLLLGTSKDEIEFSFSSYNGPAHRVTDNKFEEILKGGNYTASVEITELDAVDTNLALMISFRNSTGAAIRQIVSPMSLSGKQIGRIVFTAKLAPLSLDSGVAYIEVHLRNTSPGGSSKGKYREMKLEKGNKATDWIPAPEDVQEQIDEAKQEAEEAKKEAQKAKTTADGKNTVFRQSSQPPTTGRKIGDVWFDTSRDNLMHVFNGTSWVQAKWGERSLAAESVTALHIKSLEGLNVNDQFVVDSQGNVKFAGHLEGASGTFGEVSVLDGDFTSIDTISGQESSIVTTQNLIQDHSFELVRTQNVGEPPQSWLTYNWAEPVFTYPWTEKTNWRKSGNPKIAIQWSTDTHDATPMFGDKAAVVSSLGAYHQFLHRGFGAGGTYTLSAYFKRQHNVAAGGIPRLRVFHWKSDAYGNETAISLADGVFPPVPSDYRRVRHAVTFTVPADFNGIYDKIEVVIRGNNDRWIQADGVQLVVGNKPAPYLPEDGLWDLENKRLSSLWVGAIYPNASHTVVPDKPLSDCRNGWILQWQAHTPGSGTDNSNFQYSIIPKVAHYGRGHRMNLIRGNNLVEKYIYVYDDRIVGNNVNGTAPNNSLVLTEVYEF